MNGDIFATGSRGSLKKARVLDFSSFKAGPVCGQILADMGAEVIRVERPGGGFDRDLAPYAVNGKSLYVAYTCRNKKGITLNLQSGEGRGIMCDLVAKADIIIENYGPDVNRKFGLDYASLQKIRPDIIAVAFSAYGQNGPDANRPGFDGIIQGVSGIMWVTGFPEGKPVRAGVSFIDTASGISGALGAVLALLHRNDTGEGQLVDISLLDVGLMFTESIFGEYEVGGYIRPQVGNANVLAAPYDAFCAKDGWISIGTATPGQWQALCRTIGDAGMADDPDLRTVKDRVRPESREKLTKWLSPWVAQRTVGEAMEQLIVAGVPCGPVNKLPEVMSDPQVKARNMIVELEHPGLGPVPLPGVAIKLSRTQGEIKTPAPAPGEHNEEVYGRLLGLKPGDLARLKRAGVI